MSVKTLLTWIAVFAFAVFWSSAFAQYGWGGGGWGGGTFNGNGGNSVFALLRDVCPNGDLSPSFYDRVCGNGILATNDLFTGLLITGPEGNISTLIKRYKKRLVKFTKFLETLSIRTKYKRRINLNNGGTGTLLPPANRWSVTISSSGTIFIDGNNTDLLITSGSIISN